ncbi:winged helix-turn-helix transcriptional regulator [Variovorax terrae]|uniref:Winged helix-turn-helix transcriptional regulator n=1 Tax=Variovorax terrae TaxID=2923278 RepID=A0A9X2ANG2_9BURK|nr:winged helix-turn-helix transcriptional regulator [Variovorax terrae]MCJ0764793.1 winged helix-turn-helix transcriptional regulator [Variovorax terrae]
MALTPDLDLTRDALASSTLSHGLHLLGDRWTVAVILGAFLGVRRFDDWQARLGIPRHTLAERLKALTELGLLRQRPYQQRPLRQGYHLTAKGLALYNHVLMMWTWERRWGVRASMLPQRLVHRGCGHAFVPQMACAACGDRVGVGDLMFSLHVNAALQARVPPRLRAARLSPEASAQMGLGLRVDRWALLIVSAVLLGCHYFDQLSHVLGIGSSVLARRLAGMVDSGLLLCQADLNDARRRIYRLTPASRDLFGYIICFSSWASRYHFHEPSSIRPTHKGCGQPFVPQVVCSHCHAPLQPWEVRPEGLEGAAG